jgi:DNA-directed RNA polymerase specialized sigma24 family protein
VIAMRYFLDLSEAEMAQALDVAPGTIKSRLARARDRLRGTLDAAGVVLGVAGD